jgi:hypothetical protein
MSAIAKNTSLQMMSSAAQQMSKAFPADMKIPMHSMDLDEARQLLQFATIIVLVSEKPAHGKDAELMLGESVPPCIPPAKLNTFGFFGDVKSRARASGDNHDIEFGDVKVNFSTMEASRQGDPLKLTTLEFKVLKYLIQNARRVISRDELLNEVWGYENYPTTRSVDNQVAKLRKKMERDTSRPIHFHTIHGAGYKFLP